jgi:hypothetical protein
MNKLRVIGLIVNGSIWLLALGALGASTFIVLLPNDKFVDIEQPHWEITSKSLQEQLRVSLPESENPIRLTVVVLEMQLPLRVELKALIVFMAFVVSAYMIWILLMIKRIIYAVRRDDAFNAESNRRLKLIGTLVVLGPAVEWVLHGVFSYWVSSSYHFEGMKLETDSSLGWPVFMLGLFIVVLGVAFEQGRKIREENELTI